MPDFTVIFDLDGTLVDTAEDVAALINPMFAELGRSALSPRMAAACFGLGAKKFVERAVDKTEGPALSAAQMAELMERFGAVYATAPPVLSRPFPGVVAALEACAARGWRMGVCTNKPRAAAEILLSALGMMRFFAGVSGGDSAPSRKPDPVHLFDAIERVSGCRTRAVLVGDSETDAVTAQNAGVPVILMEGGYTHAPLSGLGADAVLPGFAALLPVLDRYAAAAAPLK